MIHQKSKNKVKLSSKIYEKENKTATFNFFNILCF